MLEAYSEIAKGSFCSDMRIFYSHKAEPEKLLKE